MKRLIFFFLLLANTLWVSAPQAADKQYLLSEKTYRVLVAAQELMQQQKNDDAEAKLKQLIQQTKAASYDRAVVQQTIGYLYASKDDYPKAIDAFQQALSANALPEDVAKNLRFNLAQLLIATEQYQAGIDMMEAWLKHAKQVDSNVYVLLASAYYRLNNFAKVVDYMRLAIDNDANPKEDWYRLLLAAYLEQKQYKNAITVLETLIPMNPDEKPYWDQLSALYQQQKKEFRATAVQVLVRALDLSEAKTVVNLADMYRYLEIPYKSAKLLTEALDAGTIEANQKNLERLADSWLAAREQDKAIPVLKQLAKLDNTGKTGLKLARVLVNQENWADAVAVMRKKIDALKEDDLGWANILLGIAYYHLDQRDKAIQFFNKALAFKGQRKQATQWLVFIEKQAPEAKDAS
jgi:tetratricopeptide (TPR) repeat protein